MFASFCCIYIKIQVERVKNIGGVEKNLGNWKIIANFAPENGNGGIAQLVRASDS